LEASSVTDESTFSVSLGVSALHAISARALGPEELGVGAVEKLARGHVVAGELGDAQARSDGQASFLRRELVLGNALAQLVRKTRGGRECRFGHEHAKLVAPVARDRIVSAHAPGDELRHLAQSMVARQVPVVVVDALESIDVENDEAKRSTVTARTPEFSLELVFEVFSAVDLGEVVRHLKPAD